MRFLSRKAQIYVKHYNTINLRNQGVFWVFFRGFFFLSCTQNLKVFKSRKRMYNSVPNSELGAIESSIA